MSILGIPVHPSYNLSVSASLLEQSGQWDLLCQRGSKTGFSSDSEGRLLCVLLPGKGMADFHHHTSKANILGKAPEREGRGEVPDLGNSLDLLLMPNASAVFHFMKLTQI